MRSANDLSLVPYDSDQSFQTQVVLQQQKPEDKALLKIVNRQDKTFYLESSAF